VKTFIVIPCYNEEARLDVAAFETFLASPRKVSFILVNDGSTDRTIDVLRRLERRAGEGVRVIDQQPNKGKSEAVRVGMLAALDAGARYAGYFDADLATPLEAIPEFDEVLDENPQVDIVLGARVALLGRKIDRKATRHYLGRVFATAASLVLDLPVYDTQCGAKLFRAGPRVRQLFERPFGSRWIFDVEILARYLTGRGDHHGLYELPLRQWTDVGESRVKARDFLRAGGEMAAIYQDYGLPRHMNRLLGLLAAPFLRYAGAGGVGTLVHYVTLTGVVELFGVKPAAATLVGASVGAIVNYVLNYHLTFASKAPHARTAPRYFFVAALSAVLNGVVMWLLTHRTRLHYLVAQLVCTVLVLVFGYLLNRVWTFRRGKEPVGRALPASPVHPSPAGNAPDAPVLPALDDSER
jgi:putative flippase GtrA